MSIKAPFNFVPLSDQVVFPHWADYISHDIPFEDEESGELVVEITARSPIAVLSAQSAADPEVRETMSFNNQAFIPGSSIKGMIRSALEVMTFSKIGNKVSDDKYAVRDLRNRNLYLGHFSAQNIRCGWLRKSGESYVIEDRGLPGRISHEDLNALGLNFHQFYQGNDSRNRYRGNNDLHKSAKHKYDLANGVELVHSFVETAKPQPIRDVDNRDCYRLDNTNTPNAKRGEIIFTGQPGVRNAERGTGHHLEFIFFEQDYSQALNVEDRVIQDFKFAYFEHDKNRWSVDWAHWRGVLSAGNRIPVFFQVNNNGAVKHLGLSYLYKLPYRHSVRETAEKTSADHLDEKLDFSESIFGTVSDITFLKGRVHVGPAVSQNAQRDPVTRELVLSSPKASYYPIYIRQQKNGAYKTFMDGDAELAGWKRYPVRAANTIHPDYEQQLGNDQHRISSKFKRLESGAVFTTKIRYHNLRKEELGALISAVTFHGTAHVDSYHSLGIAKAYGYGKCNVKITNLNEEGQKKSLTDFECYMNASLPMNWVDSDQMKELKALITAEAHTEPNTLSYMDLTEFVQVKKDNDRLENYSDLSGRKLSFSSYFNPAVTTQVQDQIITESQKWGQVKEATSAIDQQFNSVKKEFIALFQAKQKAYLAELQEKRNTQERKEDEAEVLRQRIEAEKQAKIEAAARIKRQKEKEAKGAEAAAKGFDFSSVDLSKRDPFSDSLRKVLTIYIEKIHAGKYDKLKKEIAALFPESEHAELKDTLKACFAQLNTKQQKKWKAQNSAYQKKTAEWIGAEKAAEWWESDLFT